jgi:hypothetical protein
MSDAQETPVPSAWRLEGIAEQLHERAAYWSGFQHCNNHGDMTGVHKHSILAITNGSRPLPLDGMEEFILLVEAPGPNEYNQMAVHVWDVMAQTSPERDESAPIDDTTARVASCRPLWVHVTHTDIQGVTGTLSMRV